MSVNAASATHEREAGRGGGRTRYLGGSAFESWQWVRRHRRLVPFFAAYAILLLAGAIAWTIALS
ncbi:MAG TPA: hypothetical protein VLS25_13605 [Dehalococcoidia bacterium]|nr:hypothetical protein [Dehalococcoidia bacterium]